jgi:nicotinate-nucleotide pyrophosphorylase (carboxylating)
MPRPVHVPLEAVEDAVTRALAEDIGAGDVTTRAIARAGDRVRAEITAQATGVLAGVPLVQAVYRRLDRRVRVRPLRREGAAVRSGDPLAAVSGPAAAILTGERTALNFLGLLSGLATAAARYARALRGTGAAVYDTRKTAPGLRRLAKYAIAVGGGRNHRFGLYDGILIKDNHIRLAGSLTEAVRRVRARYGRRLPVEVEAENLDQVLEALAAKAEIILLDNLSPAQLKRALALIHGRAETEVSGAMDLPATRAAARLGVDRISVGALTHSSPWLPLHLEFE